MSIISTPIITLSAGLISHVDRKNHSVQPVCCNDKQFEHLLVLSVFLCQKDAHQNEGPEK